MPAAVSAGTLARTSLPAIELGMSLPGLLMRDFVGAQAPGRRRRRRARWPESWDGSLPSAECRISQPGSYPARPLNSPQKWLIRPGLVRFSSLELHARA